MNASAKLSVALQPIAAGLAEVLTEIAGEPIGFVLVVNADHIAQYVANVKREEGTRLLTELLERWRAGRADIPAHMNPDLKPVDLAQVGGETPGYGYPDWPEWCKTFNERKAYQTGIAHARAIAKGHKV